MDYKWTLCEGILDALIDDGESIVQVEGYLNYLNLPTERNVIKKTLIKMLNEDQIYISYPTGHTKENFIGCTDDKIEDYWFELTSRGRKEWENIGSIKDQTT